MEISADKVVYRSEWGKNSARGPAAPIEGSGSGGGGDDMYERLEKRVEKLEGDLGALKSDVSVIKATMATKEDLQKEMAGIHKEMNAQTTRYITWMFGIFSLFVALNAGISLLLRFVGKQ